MNNRHNSKCLDILGLIVLSLAVRIGFLWITGAYGRVINSDGSSYNQIASGLLAGYGFAWGPEQPTTFRLFGYPWLLAAIYAVTDPSPAVLQWVQAVLGLAVVVLTYALAMPLGGTRVALLAGLGVALHPVLIYLTGLTAPDVTALLCQMLLVWYAWVICRATTMKPGAIAGFVASAVVGVWLRPELLMVVWLTPLAALSGRKPRATRAKTLLVATVLATIVAVLPPIIRNATVFGEFIPFPTIGGVTFWGANNARATGGWLMPTPENWPDAEPPQLGMQGWPGLTESQSQARFYHASFDWIRSDPTAALQLLPKKLLRSWALTFADEARSRALPPVADWLNAAFGLLALSGLVIAWRSRGRLLVMLLLAPVVAWLVKTIVFYGSARQTASAMPILAIFAALGIASLRLALVPRWRNNPMEGSTQPRV